MGRWRPVVLALLAVGIAACGSGTGWNRGGEEHIVRRGETLYSIAWRYDRSPAELARWNGLGDGSLIYPGQVLRLTPPPAGTASSPREKKPLPPITEAPPPGWAWPSDGPVDVEFGGKPGPGTGILIGGRSGDAVRAAAAGRVVYAGSGLIGYGQLIILKHNDTYLSAYGYNKSVLVRENQTIKRGQRIATMGEGPERKPRLHFEIRQNGQPVDPRRYLPAR
jgi:lipoprotein NlpD